MFSQGHILSTTGDAYILAGSHTEHHWRCLYFGRVTYWTPMEMLLGGKVRECMSMEGSALTSAVLLCVQFSMQFDSILFTFFNAIHNLKQWLFFENSGPPLESWVVVVVVVSTNFFSTTHHLPGLPNLGNTWLMSLAGSHLLIGTRYFHWSE